MTALDALGPYNVLQLLSNVNTVFVSHNKGLYGDRVLAMEANASFDEVASPNRLHDRFGLVRNVFLSRFLCLEGTVVG
jgi:hypothetical protein